MPSIALAALPASAPVPLPAPVLLSIWLIAVIVATALVLLLTALGGLVLGLYRAHRMQSTPAQARPAPAASRRGFRPRTQSEARLLYSMAGAGFGAWSVDLTTGKTWQSPQYALIFGYSPALPEWSLALFLAHVVPEDREAIAAKLQDVAASGVDASDGDAPARAQSASIAFECRIRRADDAVRWIEVQGTRESRGEQGPVMFGLVHDITERKQAQAQLQEGRKRLAEAQQIAQVGSWDCDFATNQLSGSEELSRIFGLETGEFHGTFEGLLDYVHPDDREAARNTIQSACQSLRPFFFEHRIIQPSGQIRLIEAQGRVILNPEGEPVGMAGTAHDITERQAAEEHLHRLAHYDPLTGLPNRRLFYEALGKEVEVAKGQDWTVALLYVDLDRFKFVNDTFGHSMGDELLRQVAERILSCTRVRDTVGRLGGDEFGLIAISAEPDDAATMAEKIIGELQEPFVLAGHELTVTPSIGIALCPADSSDTETLIKYSDMAMYHAKAAGRNAYRFYTPAMNVRAREKLQLETALRRALDRGEFVLHFQPEIDIDSGEWTGAEALLRWNRPGHGLVMPAHFVPALEESGLIVPVGRWVIDAACRQIRQWRDAGIGGITVSVNVSAKQVRPVGLRRDANASGDRAGLVDPDELWEHVEKCLRKYQVTPDLLELELTETALMSHAEKTVELLVKLKKLGIRILVDDFGTGYSSLSYLKRFPIDTLKIDREFISDLSTDPEDRAITHAIISLAHSLNLKVIAEGVETPEQLDFLQEQRCDQAQGFYIAQPMSAADLMEIFQANGRGPGWAFADRQCSLFKGKTVAQHSVH